jgi:hypothetical protein
MVQGEARRTRVPQVEAPRAKVPVREARRMRVLQVEAPRAKVPVREARRVGMPE